MHAVLSVLQTSKGSVAAQRLTTSLTLTSTYAAATEGVTFNLVLTNAVPDGQPIKGRNVIIDFGDGSEVATVVTATDGSASVQHKYATSGFFNATASFQGIVWQHMLKNKYCPVADWDQTLTYASPC